MNGGAYRSWRFTWPAGGDPGEDAGLRLSSQGRIEMVEGDAAVRQSILLLLSVRPGERVMRPAYGCDLHRLVFAPNDETTAGLAIHYVRRAVERWEPRVEIVRLDAGAHPERPGVLEIHLAYRVRATQRLDELTYTFTLTGERS